MTQTVRFHTYNYIYNCSIKTINPVTIYRSIDLSIHPSIKGQSSPLTQTISPIWRIQQALKVQRDWLSWPTSSRFKPAARMPWEISWRWRWKWTHFGRVFFNGLVQGKIYRKPWFLPSNIGFSCNFSHHPILWFLDWSFGRLRKHHTE